MKNRLFFLITAVMLLIISMTSCNKNKDVLITGMALNQSAAVLVINETTSLTATITPDDATDKTIIWTSSNDAVATVNNSGVVTAISDGTAEIIAITQNGAKEAKCIVTVTTQQMILTSQASNVVVGLIGSGAVVIDWGDETEKTMYMLSANIVYHMHSYSESGPHIITIKGVVTQLLCTSNQLTSIDISKNTALESLSCGSNQLTSLDVNNNINLTYLSCRDNELIDLAINELPALRTFYCYNNQLTSLVMNELPALTTLNCYNNKLTSIDVSRYKALRELNCSINPLSSLDVTNNTVLSSLFCNYNLFSSLDISKNVQLKTLSCIANQLTGDNIDILFSILHSNYISGKTVDVSYNIGSESCIPIIATTRGWIVINDR